LRTSEERLETSLEALDDDIDGNFGQATRSRVGWDMPSWLAEREALMPGSSDPSDGERERYERIFDISKKLLALLVGGPPDTPLELIVEMINALLKDAQELEIRAAEAGGEIRRQLFSFQVDQASDDYATRARLASTVARLKSIGDQVAARHSTLERAISDAWQAFKELAAVSGLPSRALLDDITRAVAEIQSCSVQLERLGYERTDAVSLVSFSPGEVAAPRASVVPAPGFREVEPPWTDVMPAPGFREVDEFPVPAPRLPEVVAPPATTIQPPRDDDQPWGSFSPF
jgi:hypothetical protein